MGGQDNRPRRRSITALSRDEARQFLLKHDSYCTIDLPHYFDFADLLSAVARILEGKQLSDFYLKTPRESDNVNHPVLSNKDGRFDWRPLELIHPALYVSLVNRITERCNWELILKRFCDFGGNHRIRCFSLPVESLTDDKDKAEQINQWWEDVEQQSIELSLDYELLIRTDIVDCYAAIYTHSIAWALHTKQIAKQMRNDKSLIGNIIDDHIQDMRQGQTNGIPQGSVLMDFVAEMVLGYADTELTTKISDQGIQDYRILRFRDDYRIFVNNSRDGELILKCLTEVMIDLGLKLNPVKTKISAEVIRSSIKDDKLSWTIRRRGDRNPQRHLLIIHDHSREHPNSGSLVRAMFDYYKRLDGSVKRDFPLPLVGIVVDIAYRNPKTYAVSAAILSKLIDMLETEYHKQEIIDRINRKFTQIPNIGHVQVWLQRISLLFYPDMEFDEPLCQLVRRADGAVEIWNNDWISWRQLRGRIDATRLVNREEVEKITPVVAVKEIELFVSRNTFY